MMELQAYLDALVLQPGDLLAIDGRCGSGKTTLAQAIAQTKGATVVHMDHFFLPPELRTLERLSQPGGNVHFERVLEQVLLPWSQGKPIVYQPFQCQTQTLGAPITILPGTPILVEGSYSLGPQLRPYYTQTLWLHIDSATQQERIAQRNGPDGLAMFLQRWIPLEEAYFTHYNIPQQADITVDGNGAYGA